MKTIVESGLEEIHAATPLDMYRAVRAYEMEQGEDRHNLGISAELFDASELVGDVREFVYSCGKPGKPALMLGTMSMGDGINVDGLANLYLRRGKEVVDADQETVVTLLMDGGYIAVAVNRMALEGIGVVYIRGREQWWAEDAALKRAIGRAGLSSDVYAHNNIPQHRAGVKGPSYVAAAIARIDWSGGKERGTPGRALKIPGLLT